MQITGTCCLIFLARGKSSSCLTCTTLTLVTKKLLHPYHENLENGQGTSLPKLEKLYSSCPDPTSNHCHYPYTPLYTLCCPAGWQLWVCLPSLGRGVVILNNTWPEPNKQCANVSISEEPAFSEKWLLLI